MKYFNARIFKYYETFSFSLNKNLLILSKRIRTASKNVLITALKAKDKSIKSTRNLYKFPKFSKNKLF